MLNNSSSLVTDDDNNEQQQQSLPVTTTSASESSSLEVTTDNNSVDDEQLSSQQPSSSSEEVLSSKQQPSSQPHQTKQKQLNVLKYQNKLNSQIPLENLVSDSDLEIASKVLETLSNHTYHLTNPKLANLILAGSLVFKRKITKEEQVEMKRDLRKKFKEQTKNHDENILNGTLMKQKKMNEVHFLKQQIKMIPNAPNSEIPQLEQEQVIIESIPYDESLHSHLDNNPITSPNIVNSNTTTTNNGNDENTKNGNLLKKAIRCYICHEKTNEIHSFYHKMCTQCGQFNFNKRHQQFDLTGKICLVTGGRIKIGYYTALKLLRSNAEQVIVTTRFPKDCAKRFASEVDFLNFSKKLKIYGIDFKHIPSVVKFSEHLLQSLPRLDILINCAAQTIRKPTAYYEHVARFELTNSIENLSENERSVLPLDFAMEIKKEQQGIALKVLNSMNKLNSTTTNTTTNSIILNNDQEQEEPLKKDDTDNSTTTINTTIDNHSNNNNNSSIANLYSSINDKINISSSSLICQIPILDEDQGYNEQSFPREVYDVNQNQADFRNSNSWIATLENVPIFEMLEVQTINVTAPFILTSKLKPLLVKGAIYSHLLLNTNSNTSTNASTNTTSSGDGTDGGSGSKKGMSFVVNVSSMEGQFYRRSKGVTHPHLNMAKASLNMMTRTSAADYARDNIYMTSVDTGWNNDENPLTDLDSVQATYFCPLDEVDGAARILDPIFRAMDGKEIYFGVFLKNYEPFRW